MAKQQHARAAAWGAALAVILAQPAYAASVAEVANYTGADRQAMLEAGAKQEGLLHVYTTGTQADPVYAAFAKKYPFVRVQAFKANAPEVTRKVFEEAKAGTFNADAIDLSTGGLYPLREAGLLQTYKSPEIAKVRREVVEPSGYWAIGYESYLSLGYNTQRVSVDQAPTDLDGLLDPRWRGKMALPGGSSLVNWLGAVINDKGEDFARKLGAQQIRVYEISARAVANLVVSGEVWLSPASYNSHFANSADQGAPVAWRPLGGVFSFGGALALAANAPHPHAAMLYTDFALSLEGQAVFQKLGYASTRTDVPEKDKPAKIYYLTETPTYEKDFEHWQALSRQIFTSAK
jgi:iron(III) transport system substrate-binding protein